jgi:hypothetical protein
MPALRHPSPSLDTRFRRVQAHSPHMIFKFKGKKLIFTSFSFASEKQSNIAMAGGGIGHNLQATHPLPNSPPSWLGLTHCWALFGFNLRRKLTLYGALSHAFDHHCTKLTFVQTTQFRLFALTGKNHRCTLDSD